MNSNWQDSIVRIMSSDPNKDGLGTGFAIHCDEQGTYVVTCAHVVRAIGPETIKVRGAQASVVVSNDDIDLAVLRLDGLHNLPLLRLGRVGKQGSLFITAGFQKHDKAFLIREISGILGKEVGTEAREQIGRTKAWDLLITDSYTLQPGYSGSPVVAKENGYVIAVVSTKQGGDKGVAVSVEALPKVWPEIGKHLIECLENSSGQQGNDRVKQEPSGNSSGFNQTDHSQKSQKQAADLLEKLQRQSEWLERNFMRQWNLERCRVESECPNTFYLIPGSTTPFDSRNWVSYHYKLFLMCQYPAGPHCIRDSEGYDLHQKKDWWIKVSPWFTHLLTFLKFGIPLGIPHTIERDPSSLADILQRGGFGQCTGPALRVLHSFLKEADPNQYWDGLQRVVTEDGNIFWLCEEHARPYQIEPCGFEEK